MAVKNEYTTHKVRVQEPGSTYYMEHEQTRADTVGDFLVLRKRDGSTVGVWNKDCVVYCVPTEDKGGYATHKIRVRDPATTYFMIHRDTKLEIKDDFVVLRSRDGSEAGHWARASVVYCVPHIERQPRNDNR